MTVEVLDLVDTKKVRGFRDHELEESMAINSMDNELHPVKIPLTRSGALEFLRSQTRIKGFESSEIAVASFVDYSNVRIEHRYPPTGYTPELDPMQPH